jgi:hypothetical protein
MDRAQDGLVSVQEAFEQLSARVGDSVIAKWKEEETQALAHGGVGRKIYKAEAVESTSNPTQSYKLSNSFMVQALASLKHACVSLKLRKKLEEVSPVYCLD